MLINICLYFSSKNSETLDLTPGNVVEITSEETAFIEQAVNGETDVWTGHLEPARHKNQIRIKGVMHHHQNHCFTLRRWRRPQGESGCEFPLH